MTQDVRRWILIGAAAIVLLPLIIYTLDTVRGADLGHDGDRIILDFNYAYHPSCVHDHRWSCPLAPPENRLEVEVRAGERLQIDPRP